MPVTVVTNVPGSQSQSGATYQSRLIYARNQQRWWLFFISEVNPTLVVSCYFSSSKDLVTSTWTQSTNSPSLPAGYSFPGIASQRSLCVLSFTNDTTDVVHLASGVSPDVAHPSLYLFYHIRATFTGVDGITWETWNEYDAGHAGGPAQGAVEGTALGLSYPSRFLHVTSWFMQPDGPTKWEPYTRISANPDTGATWTNSWNAPVSVYSGGTFNIQWYAFAPLDNDAMMLVYGDGVISPTNASGMQYNLYPGTGTSWPTTGSADVGWTAFTINQNDACVVKMDLTHNAPDFRVFVIRRSAADAVLMKMFDGVSTWSDLTPPPDLGHKLLSGYVGIPTEDGTGFYLFQLESTGNQALYYNRYDIATDSWESWTLHEAEGATARGFLCGCPYVGNGQMGLVFSQVNGANWDICVSAFTVPSGSGDVFLMA